MYICEHCSHVFDECGNTHCPQCNSEYFEIAQKCCVCGKYLHPDNMASAHCCNQCVEENSAEKTFMRYLKERNLEPDFYVNWITESKCCLYSVSDMLLHICKTVFKNMSSKERSEKIKTFIKNEQDADNFASWLEVDKGE